jgi:hypothetical protein
LQALQGLKKLRDLRCSQCSVGKVDFSGSTGLRSLDLNNTRFTDAGLASLANMKGLCRPLMRDSLVTDEGMRAPGPA